MTEKILREIVNPTGTEKVLIVQRSDDRFTYKRQFHDGSGWSLPTIDAGIYDSPDTAETEARQRIGWLRALFH